MAEVAALLPESLVQVPDELVDVFQSVLHALHPDTPIRKTTQFTQDNTYPETHGPIIPLDTEFMDGISIPTLSLGWSLSRFGGTNPIGIKTATAVLRGQIEKSYAKIAFAEEHLTGEARDRYGPELDIWQLAVEAQVQSRGGVNRSRRFAINSRDEFVGRVITWRGSGVGSRAELFDRDPKGLTEITQEASHILIPHTS